MAEFSNRNLDTSIDTVTEIKNQYKTLLDDLNNLQENIDDYLDDVEIDKEYHKIFTRLVKITITLHIKYNTLIAGFLSYMNDISELDEYNSLLFETPSTGMDILKLYDESLQNTVIDTEWIIYNGVSKLIYETTYNINIISIYYKSIKKLIYGDDY